MVIFSGNLVVSRLERTYPYPVCIDGIALVMSKYNRMRTYLLEKVTPGTWVKVKTGSPPKFYIYFSDRDAAIRFRMMMSA